MGIYSHSKVSTFEQCPYKYKLHYIDKIKPEIENTIEAFMGDIVHRSLEMLYRDLKFQKKVSKKDLINFYKKTWEKEISEDIKIVKKDLTSENYKKMGEKFLIDYFETYKPFDQLTILGLETQDKMILPDGNFWHVRIDKFACDNEGNYYVCDYKTNSRMKDQEEADSDRQLAMYSFWVKDKFKDAKSVKLLWHMLAFNKEVVSERSKEQLEKLQNEVVNLIKKIEEAKDFPRKVSALCEYCGFKSQCPSFVHKEKLEKKEVKDFKEDEGVKLVDEFSKVRLEKKGLEEQENKLKEDLISYSKKFGVDYIYGSNMKLNVKEVEKISLPEDKEEIISLMKEKGLWEDFAMINFMKFQSKFMKGEVQEDIAKMISREKDYRLSLSKRRDVEEGE